MSLHTVDTGAFRPSRGQPIPFLIGALNGVPAIPVCAPATDALARDVTNLDPATGGAWLLSNPLNWSDFPSSGRVLCDSEWIDYTGKRSLTNVLIPTATDTGADTVDFAVAHGWAHGTLITVSASAGGLLANTFYYIHATDANTISFHTTVADALAGTNKVNLTATITASIQPAALTLTDITRGAGGSGANAHGKGTPTYEVISPHVYVLGENPGTLRLGAVRAVSLGGIPQPIANQPVCTVRLADGLVQGASVASLSFDMASLDAPATTQFITPGSLAAALRYEQYINEYIRQGMAAAAALQARAIASGGLFTYSYTPSLPWARQPLIPIAMLPAVTADVTGLLDDPVGTWTGTPNSLIEVPSDVVRFLLRYAFDQPVASLQDASWAATRAQQVADGLTWAFAFTAMPFNAFQQLAGLQGRATLILEGGVWKYLYRQIRTVAYTVTARDAIGKPTLDLTPPAELVTAFAVTYGQESAQQQMLVQSLRVGVSQSPRPPVPLALPWITSPVAAESIANDLLLERDVPALRATATLAWPARILGRTDGVALDLPLMDDFGPRVFQVRGLRHLPGGLIRVRLVEGLSVIMGRGGLRAPLGGYAGTGSVFGGTGAIAAPPGLLAGTGELTITGSGGVLAPVGELAGTGIGDG